MSYRDKYIYLDSAASDSNPKFYVMDDFANPNSVHDAGRDSFAILESSRKSIAKAINAKRPSEIVFTSGATESNNTAIFGIARATAAKKMLLPLSGNAKPNVVISAIEHESILLPAKELNNQGFELRICPVDKNGFLNMEAFEQLVDKNTVLVSVHSANTEIGTIQNLKPLIEIAHKFKAYFHSDFVGSYCKIKSDVQDLNIDSASIAGHKIGTAKGIGVLYLKSDTPCKPLMYGSGQEHGVRGGTQNVAMAASLQKATEYALSNMESANSHYLELRDFLIKCLRCFPFIKSTIDLEAHKYSTLPNIVHLLYKGYSSQTLILHYGKFNISVAGGPACSAEEAKPSHVLEAIGVDKDLAFNALRISFTEETTKQDLQVFIDATKKLI